MDFVLNALKKSVVPYCDELAEDPLNLNLKDFVKKYLFTASTPLTRAIQADPVLKGLIASIIKEQGDDLVLGHSDTYEMLEADYSAFKANENFKLNELPKHLQKMVASGQMPMPTQLKTGDTFYGHQSNGDFVAVISRADGSKIIKSNAGEQIIRKKKSEPDGWDLYNFNEEWKTDRYVKIPYEIFQDGRLTSTTRLVLIALTSYANHSRNGLCYPSREELSKSTGFSISTLSRATEALVNLGWLSKYQPDIKSSAQYHLHIPVF